MISRSIAVVVLLSVSAVSAEVSPFRGHGAETAPATTLPIEDAPGTTELDNPFLPEEANIGDCVSAVPRPDCGSKARGGWRQALVFVVLIVAIALIGLRLVLGLRKRARQAG